MKIANQPPVYRDTKQLVLLAEQAVENFSRYRKYTIGTDLREPLDIHNFFICLNRSVLYQRLCQCLDKCLSKDVINATKHHEIKTRCHALVNQKAHENTIYRGGAKNFKKIPPHKRLMHSSKGCGIAVGNLSNQFFSNVYLNALDQFVKHTLKAKYYVRYMDDFVLVSDSGSEKQLLQWREEIAAFIGNNLDLSLKANSNDQLPQPINTGCGFGYVIYPTHKVVRRRVIQHCRKNLLAWQQRYVKYDINETIITVNREAKQAILGVVASYWGYFSHTAFVKLIQRLLQEFAWLGWLFRFSLRESPQRRWVTKQVSFLQDQITFFTHKYPQCELVIPCGVKNRVITSSNKTHEAPCIEI